ncbi:MAG: DUF1992 domain-containing protein [Actinophytocola sp.]|uniref:DnaJ family domain-containing protein n=1 Tax=Actinophytocola sp. TaxID=1872138 RepID=UPI001320B9C4|nr:DUF1992 domain-containing protein [Actinophytocola sp.]MPZ81127.1 DUF1992 domain-containing protein [Actinophytocola sp.]
MTERKPPAMPVEDWVERQIRMAQERGDLDDLPGAGKPIPNRRGGTMEWVAQKLRGENADIAALLPPSLALPKEVADLPARLTKEQSEQRVREIVADLNARIAKAHREPQVGPPLRMGPVVVEEAVESWRAAR